MYGYSKVVVAAAITLVLAICSLTRPDVVEFTDPTSWHWAVDGDFSTIDFTGFPDTTPINNQYANLGVTFTGLAFIIESIGFVNDGWGLHGPNGLYVEFDMPMKWMAVDYPGGVQFELYSNEEVVYTSTFFQPGGLGHFAGLVSTVEFDAVYIFRPPWLPNHIAIDDLHWGGGEPKSPCPEVVGDLTGDCSVGVADLLVLLSQWGPCPPPAPGPGNCPADLTGSSSVGVDDLLLLLANWG